MANGDPRFASELRQAIDEHGVGIKEFARLYAAQRGKRITVETARSNIQRWLRCSSSPTRRNRVRAARALGEPPDRFLVPDEQVTVEVLADRLEELSDLVDDGLARLQEGLDDGLARLEAGIARVEQRLADANGPARESRK